MKRSTQTSPLYINNVWRWLAACCAATFLTCCTDLLMPDAGLSPSAADDQPDGMGFTLSTTEQADLLYTTGRTRAAARLPLLDSATVAHNTPTVTPLQGDAPQPLFLHRQALPLVGIHAHAVQNAPAATATRATEADIVALGDNPLNFHDSLTIWGFAYNETGTYSRTLFERTLLKKIRGWRSSVHWPYDDGQSQFMRFYAVAPAFEALDDIEETVAPSYAAPPTFSYGVPDDPALQVDLLYGESDVIDVQAGPDAEANYPYADTPKEQHLGEDDKVIPLTFRHILTAIRFAQGKMPLNVTITRLKLTGVCDKGTYTPATATWSGQTGEQDYEIATSYSVEENNPDYKDKDEKKKADAWRGAENIYIDNSQVLFLMPQTLPTGAKLHVYLHKDGDDEGIERKLTATIGSTTWPAGYTVTYQISISELYDNYYLLIDPSKTSDEKVWEHNTSTTDGSFTIHSYKNYTDITLKDNGTSEDVHHAVPWQITGFARPNADGTMPEADYDPKNRPEWLSSITGWNDSGGENGEGHAEEMTPGNNGDNITVSYRLSSVTDNPTYTANHATVLQENTPVTSGTDLTQYEPDGRNSYGRKERVNKESANCYIINAAGYDYQFPMVYGNANPEDFTPNDIFKDHEGNTITEAYILNQVGGTEERENVTASDPLTDDEKNTKKAEKRMKYTREGYFLSYADWDPKNGKNGTVITDDNDRVKAELIWQDTDKQIFSDIKIDGSNISFDVERNNLTPCNAVIALLGKKAKHEYWWLEGTELSEADKLPYKQEFTVSKTYDTLWTWHIWITDEVYPNRKDYDVEHKDGFSYATSSYSRTPIDSVYVNPCDANGNKVVTLLDKDGNETAKMLPVNLGWVPDNPEWHKYEPREVWIEIEQIRNSGDEEKYKLPKTPNRVHYRLHQDVYQDLITGTSTVYQWGRPTALPQVLHTKKVDEKFPLRPVYNSGGTKDIALNFKQKKSTTFAEALCQPTKFLLYEGDNHDGFSWFSKNDRKDYWSSTTKTIYDPCPPGFQLPAVDVFNFLARDPTKSTTDGNNLNIYPDAPSPNGKTLNSAMINQGGHFYIQAYSESSFSRYAPTVYMPSTGEWQVSWNHADYPDDASAMQNYDDSSTSDKNSYINQSQGILWTGEKNGDKAKTIWYRPRWDNSSSSTKTTDLGKEDHYGNAMPIRPVSTE